MFKFCLNSLLKCLFIKNLPKIVVPRRGGGFRVANAPAAPSAPAAPAAPAAPVAPAAPAAPKPQPPVANPQQAKAAMLSQIKDIAGERQGKQQTTI